MMYISEFRECIMQLGAKMHTNSWIYIATC